MELAQLKKQFILYLETELGRRPKTVENYNRYLERFLAFTQLRQREALTEEVILDFRHYLKQQPGKKIGSKTAPMEDKTQNYHLIALRSFLKFLRYRGFETVSLECVPLTKSKTADFSLLSKDELERLLLTPIQTSLVGKRDLAILELLASAGVRVSELCCLSVIDVDLARGEVFLRGKTGLARTVFLTETAQVTLAEYLESRHDTQTALFVRYGKKAHLGKVAGISPRTVQRLIKHHAVLAGISKAVTPQSIRHSFAVSLISSGVDINTVQSLLGHEHLASTKVYTRLPTLPLAGPAKKSVKQKRRGR